MGLHQTYLAATAQSQDKNMVLQTFPEAIPF